MCPLQASEADLIVPEEFHEVKPLELTPAAEREARAATLFLRALFEEETEGPDSALETKRELLAIDPGFSSLAIEAAHQYLRRGETSEAISVLKDAAKANASDSRPALVLSTIYLRQLQKPELAERYAQQALSTAPDDPGGYEALWDVLRSTGQRQRIEALFARAARRTTTEHEFWLALAELRLRDRGLGAQGKEAETAQAVAFLEKAAGNMADAETLVRAADFFVLCNRVDRAAELYRIAAVQRPEMDGLLEKLAACLLQLGDLPQAATILEEVVKANPLDVRAYDKLAAIHLRAGQPERALANLKQTLLLAAPDPRRFADAIRLSLGTGDTEGALALAGEAEGRFPGDLQFTLLGGIALSEKGRHAEAIKAFERILVGAPNSQPELLDADFFFSYGVAAEQAGRTVKAAELFKQSIALDPENSARASNYLGYMWADRNENLDEAEALIRQALAQDPDNGAYIDSLGWVLYRKGRYEEALAELLRAAEKISEPDPVVYDHIGDAYNQLGRTAEAVLYWQKAHALDPDNAVIARKLDTLSAPVAQQPKTTKRTPTP